MSIFDLWRGRGSPDATRKAMLQSYEKHLNLAKAGKIPTAGMSPHYCGLYGALATRYMARGTPRPEITIWKELGPFMLMDKQEAPKVLAEYIVAQEDLESSDIPSLRNKLNSILRKSIENNASEDELLMSAEALEQPDILWTDFIDPTITDSLRRKVKQEFRE